MNESWRQVTVKVFWRQVGGASSEKVFWRQVGGASLVAAIWQQIGPSSSFLNDGAVQCSDSTVQCILYCKYTV